jgi:CheY-like chemotaxis protein
MTVSTDNELEFAEFGIEDAVIIAQPGTICVVEDNAVNRVNMVRCLERDGFTVISATDGAQGLALIRREQPDLVLLDLFMPGLDGRQVLECMKNDPQLQHIPVIVVSSVAEVDTVVQCIALGADGTTVGSGRVILASGDVAVGPAENLDAVVVAKGDAEIAGQVATVVVLDGNVALMGSAIVGDILDVGGTISLGPGTTVQGDIWTVGATVEQGPSAVVQGSIGSFETQLAGLGVVLVPFLILLSIGAGLVGIVAALLVAALAARQVRRAEEVIRRQPGRTLGVGILGVLVPPILAVLLMVTVVGIPLGLTFLFVAWPAVGLAGYLVAAIFIGDAVVAQLRAGAVEERPYLAAILGVLVLAIAGIVPFVTAIASLFGLGAVLLTGWRVWRHETAMQVGAGAAV